MTGEPTLSLELPSAQRLLDLRLALALYSSEELHRLAERIRLKRAWFQDGRVLHYDLVAGMRERAIQAGAWPVTRWKAVEIWRRCGMRPRSGVRMMTDVRELAELEGEKP